MLYNLLKGNYNLGKKNCCIIYEGITPRPMPPRLLGHTVGFGLKFFRPGLFLTIIFELN